MNNLITLRSREVTRKIEITLQVEKEGFVIENVESGSSENKLLMNLRKGVNKNE